MTVLSDFDLRNYIKNGRLVIEPFSDEIIRENGLDLRIGPEVARFKKTNEVFSPGESRIEDFYEVQRGEHIVIQPHEHVLLHTLEYIRVPDDLMGFVNLRSTFARLGLFVPPTIVDAGFEGQLTIEMIGGEFPVKLNVGERFLHVVFAKLSSPVQRAYRGKYQGQRGVKLPSV